MKIGRAVFIAMIIAVLLISFPGCAQDVELSAADSGIRNSVVMFAVVAPVPADIPKVVLDRMHQRVGDWLAPVLLGTGFFVFSCCWQPVTHRQIAA
jgi:hypothetical protein